MEQIVSFTSCAPIFLHKPENLRKLVEKVDAMGLDRRSRNFIHGVRVVGSMTNESWEAKVKTLRDLGFSEDVMRAFRNSPKVFSSSSEKMKRMAEVLIGTGKYDGASMVAAPYVFQYDIQKRMRPRFQVLSALEEKKLILKWPSLASFTVLSNANFYKKYVAPYADGIGELRSRVSQRGNVKA